MELPQRRRNVSWFLCICIMCASSVYSKDTDTPIDAQDQSKRQGSDENKSDSYQIVQSDSEADKKEEAMRSDTGEPPGAATYTRQPESGNDQVTTEDDNKGIRDEIQEEPETANTETMPVVPIPPVLGEEDGPASGTAIKEVREEESLKEERQQNISGGQQEENLPEVDYKVKTSEDVVITLVEKEEADAGSMDSHGDETQIEAPAFAEENISDGETAKDHQEAEEEVATKDEDRLQMEEGNVTSEDLKEGEKPEGTETVQLEDEKKEQEEEEEKKEEKEDGEGVGEGDGEEEDKEEDDVIPEPIPSFDEWKEKMLQKALEEQEKLYGSRNDIPSLRHRQFVLKDSKNYASSDCGAKILSANDEAQKPNLVLNFNRDEYMINPCSANIWFIVELCEPIQIKLLEIANLELFSSVPESFRVYTSDRFPAREWRLLGTLYAREERNLQSFLIDEHLFTKFVKIELLTFFGKEHYCPLTVVRIFGTSMDEEIDSEEPDSAVLPPNPTPLAADLKENGILDHAKDAVISFVKNAAKAFTGEKKDQDCQGEDCERVVPDEVAPTPATECWNGDLTTSMPDVEQADLDSGAPVCSNPCDDLESEDFLRVCAAAVCEVQDYWRIFPNCCLLVLAQTTLHLCCSISNCYLTGSSTRDVSVGNAKGETPTGGVAKVPLLEVIPLETIPSTGHLIISNLERGRPVVFSSNLLLPSMSETDLTVSSSPTPANTVPPAPVFSTPVSAAETISQAQLKNSAQEHNVQRTIAPTPSFKGSEEVDVEISSPSARLPSVVGTSSSMEGTDKNLPTSETTPTTVPAPSSSVGTPGQGSESPPAETASSDVLRASVTSEEKEDEAEVPEKLEENAKKTDKVPKVVETPSSEGNAKQEGKVTDPGAKGDSAPTTTTGTEVIKVDENGSKTDSAAAKATESSQPQKATEPSHGNGAGAHVGISNYGAQKDSVFMRLNNRIKSLELNLSLSSKYLEELSKSYKKQMEEMQKSFNKTVTTLTEKVVKSQEKHTTNTADISRIDGQVEELTGIVSSISIKIEDILQEVIERHLFLMICEVLFFCSLFMICVRRERNQLRLARAMYEHHLDAPQRRNTMCASNPSQHSPRGSLRKGGTLRPSGSLDDLLIIGPTTPLREAMKANSGHQTKVKPKHKTVIQARTNGSLTDLTQQKQPMKTAKRKIDSYSTGNVANPAGIIFNGSSELKEESKSDSKILGRHSPETIGALNGSSNSKHKKVQNGSKVKR